MKTLFPRKLAEGCVFFFLLTLLSTLPLTGAESFVMVKDGKALRKVTIAPKSNAPALALARTELINYTKLVTGADLAAGVKPGIVLALWNDPALPKEIKSKLAPLAEDEEGFCIQKVKDTLYIAAKHPVGVLYGVYEIMEKDLGVYFFFPGKDGERWSKKSSFAIQTLDRLQKPFFRYRILSQVASWGLAKESRIWAARNNFSSPGPWGIKDTMVRYRDFHEARIVLKRAATGGHLTFEQAVPPKKYAASNPEYFSLVDGKRRTTGKMLHHCISNEKVQELLYQHILNHFQTYGVENTSYLFGAPDTLRNWCDCQNCKALDGSNKTDVSRRFHLVSQKIAQRVWKKFPKAELQAWAYWNYRELPEGVKIDPRTVIYFCSTERCYAHTLDDPACRRNVKVFKSLKKWMKVSKRIYMYEYGMAVPFGYQPYTEIMLKDTILYKKLGLLGRKEEMKFADARYSNPKKDPLQKNLLMGSRWQFWYLLGKALYYGKTDPALIADAEKRFYGKCYPAMKEYNDLRRKLWKDTNGCVGFPYADARTPLLLQLPGMGEKLLSLLAKAAKQAKGDPKLEKWVALEKQYLEGFWIRSNEKYRESMGRRLTAPTVKKAPVIDGKIQDPAWKNASYIGGFLTTFQPGTPAIPANLATTVGLVSDSKNIYCLIQAKEPAAQALAAQDTAKIPFWQRDLFEIFIAPVNNACKYYQIVVDAKGNIQNLEQPGNNTKIDLGATAKSVIANSMITLEIKIPTTRMEGNFTPGAGWKMHVTRSRKIKDGNPATIWSIDGIKHHLTTDYRSLHIGEVYLRNGSFEEGKNKNGSPKSWGLNGKNKPVLLQKPNGQHYMKLVTGGDLRQILYKGFFMPKTAKKFQLTFHAAGKGVLYVSNARFTVIRNEKGKTANKFLGSKTMGKVNLTPEGKLYTVEGTVAANEFAQLIFAVHGKGDWCTLDDVFMTIP